MVLDAIDWEDDAVMLEAALGTASHIGKITWPEHSIKFVVIV